MIEEEIFYKVRRKSDGLFYNPNKESNDGRKNFDKNGKRYTFKGHAIRAVQELAKDGKMEWKFGARWDQTYKPEPMDCEVKTYKATIKEI